MLKKKKNTYIQWRHNIYPKKVKTFIMLQKIYLKKHVLLSFLFTEET